MKRYLFMSVLLLSVLAVPAVFSQEFEPEDMEMQVQMHQQQMDLDQRKFDMDMERQMKQLDLEQRKREMERALHDDDDRECEGVLAVLLVICAVVHILVAVWVYMDIRQLNRGSGIWIVIALLTGLLGALVYAVVRIGDNKQKS